MLRLVALAVAHASGSADAAGWARSFEAGHTDARGRYAGGSEVLHLAAHAGALYAGVGYWEDRRYVEGRSGAQVIRLGSPDAAWQEGRSGAQVIRLGSPDAAWQVDLECGPLHMKLSILKAVTFTRDKAGRLLDRPVGLLLAAAGRSEGPDGNPSSVSVFTRDDGGNWTRVTVLQGSPQQGRWDPRALEVHTDSVTGIERIFLCIGNPGVLAGVYDPDRPGRIRWDAAPEISGLATRPLAMAVAGGRLFFSAGSRVYRRADGAAPSWSAVLAMNSSTVNPDSGGIRGLTSVAAPGVPAGAPGGSLLFMYVPDGRSRGCIYRLDLGADGALPPGSPGQETCASALVSKALGTRVEYTLGAYNRMFAASHPATGEPVHLIGLEAKVPEAAAELRWNEYYRGAMFAIRWESGRRYSLGEVNGGYRPGGPPLEAARAFALSPFLADSAGGPILYIAGFDANFNPATNTAWIFRANLSVALAPSRGPEGPSPGAAAPPSGDGSATGHPAGVYV